MGRNTAFFYFLIFSLLFCGIFKFGNSQVLKQPNSILDQLNAELRQYNHYGAEIAWEMSTNLENFTELMATNEQLILKKNLWNNDWCLKLLNHKFESLSDQRQIYLVCRGPRFSSYQLSNLLSILAKLRKVYDTRRVCLLDGNCYRMEPDLSNLMESTRDEKILKNAWTQWHKTIGQELSEPFAQLVKLMNTGARQAGRKDIGVCWREEMETQTLKKDVLRLYSKVKRLFTLLHAFVRFKLEKYYKIDLNRGPIPSHLLGNMWGQRWDSLINIVWPKVQNGETVESHLIEQNIGRHATVGDMVTFVNKFYIKMGFPPLPSKFYQNSYFESNSTSRNCHGSAANMFGFKDYRVMMCAKATDSDLLTLLHEVGHIHYFMAYENLPTVFQDGANAGFHEAVGDAVTYGMLPNPSLRSLMQLGLFKLPQIAFGFVVDSWRWKIFEREDEFMNWNQWWWELNHEFLGVRVPDGYSVNSGELEALGKYHIVDNIPYVRYFYASFLQHMFYKAMCKGQTYCSLQSRGEGFRKMLSRGTSAHWSETLEEFTGSRQVTAKPLLEYYKPLQDYLEQQIRVNQIPMGWSGTQEV